MAFTMTLGGVSLGENFPLYSRSAEYIRQDDQGPGFRKIKLTLAGFIEGASHAAVMALYETLHTLVGTNNTSFTFIDGSTTIYSSKGVYVASYNEPEDNEYAKSAVGDYSIELYYFAPMADTINLPACTYGAYTFETCPKWSRTLSPNRESFRGEYLGTTAAITLAGFLYANNHSALMAKIIALQDAFMVDELLTYGVFSQTVRVEQCYVQEAVQVNYTYYSIALKYSIGTIVSLRKKKRFSRVHNNPVITEEPFCNRRHIELMNESGQTISYSLSVEAEDMATCRSELATEIAGIMEPGGIEMPGGEENWDYDQSKIDISIVKFHDEPVLSNMAGT